MSKMKKAVSKRKKAVSKRKNAASKMENAASKRQNAVSIKILLVDDHKIMREGLRALLENQTGMKIVGEASTGREAVQLAGKLKPDVVIMDIVMPDLSGIEATRRIVKDLPKVKIIALSMYSDKGLVGGILRAGAAGFLLKDCASVELAQAIISVVAGKPYLSQKITHVVIWDYAGPRPVAGSVLSRREHEVIQLLAKGMSTKQAAGHLHVSVETLQTYRKRLMTKLDVSSIAELTKYAIRQGLTSL